MKGSDSAEHQQLQRLGLQQQQQQLHLPSALELQQPLQVQHQHLVRCTAVTTIIFHDQH
jgi:hypothetical protein